MANKRKCICCGKIYEYCPNCKKSNNEPWMVTFDCILCKELFNEVSLYNVKRISKKNVQDFVKQRGITNFAAYEAPIRKVLEETKEVVEKTAPERKSVISSHEDDIPETKADDDTFSSLLHRKKKKRRGY